MARGGFWIVIVLIVAVVASMIFFASADLAAPVPPAVRGPADAR